VTQTPRRPLYSFSLLLPHRVKEEGWSCDWPDVGKTTWDLILPAQSFRCFYCGNPLLPATATPDHLHPISKGGCGCVGNLVGACFSCNSMKRDKPLGVFLRERPSFLRTMGQFSTRVLYLKRDALFWDHFRSRLVELAALKSMQPSADARRTLQNQKIALYRRQSQ
jgi:hypothetical protein